MTMLDSESVKCPECEKLVKVAPMSQKIGEFLDWLREKELFLARYHVHSESCEDADGTYNCGFFFSDSIEVVHISTEKLLADFFEIDLEKVEQERRALLDAIRQ